MQAYLFRRSTNLTFLIVGLLLASFFTNAQPGFQKAIGMGSFEKGTALKLLPDGGFIVAGEVEDLSTGERDMLLTRLDSSGNLIWSGSYGGPERETVNDVLPQVDGSFMMLGEKYQPDKKEGENLTLAKTNASGKLLWKKIFDEGGNETEGFTMQATPDRANIIVGMVKNMSVVSSAFFSMNAENQGLYLLKVDDDGEKIWSRRFNYGTQQVSSTGTAVTVASDGSYIITGNIARKGQTDKKIERPAQEINADDVRTMLLAKVKPNGQLAWAKEYEAGNISMGFAVIEKQEGGFLVAGNVSITYSNFDIFLMSVDNNGNVLWGKSYGGAKFESVADVVQLPDGGFVVTGITFSSGQGSSDVLSFKTNSRGEVIWAKTYGGQNEDMPSRMALTPSGIVYVGTTASFGSESFDVLLMKTEFDGTLRNAAKPATLTVKDFSPVGAKIDKASMGAVEQGIFPPNMKKPDAGNIVEHKREARVTNLSD